MRFFSNDARESADDQPHDDRTPEQRAQDEQSVNEQALTDRDRDDQDQDGRPDRVQSDPVAVPNQRAGSPWSDTPAAPGSDDPAQAERVGTSSTNTYAGSTADTSPDTVPATWSEDERNRDRTDPVVDLPLDDQDGDGRHPDRDTNRDDAVTTFDASTKHDDLTDRDDLGDKDDPADRTSVIDPVTDRPAGSTVDGDTRTDVAAVSAKDDLATDEDKVADSGVLKDDGGFEDPKVADPVVVSPAVVSPAPVSPAPVVASSSVTEPVVADAGSDKTGTSPVVAAPDTLFNKDDAASFQERWRDVQLRFVDSPKDAAGDAAKLVEEAVDKLTAALRSQREGLHADTEDTEQLRVQLRGYRDMLNRIVGL